MRDTSDPAPNLDPPGPRDFGREAYRLARYAAAPAVVFVLLSNHVLGSRPVARWLDKYRPSIEGVSTLIHVEMQMLHMEAMDVERHARPLVAFTGSSSVVNAIDSALVDSIWSHAGYPAAPINYGLTMLTAYELPILKRHLLGPDVAAVVYLYNGFSFSNRYHPDAVGSRFDAAEFLRLFGWRSLLSDDFYKGVLGQTLFVARYRNVIHETAARAALGRLVVLDYAYDNPPGEAVRGRWREHSCERAAPDANFTRVRHLESAADSTTVGYAALERFFALAKARGVRVVVAPVPVPDYSACSRYRRGIDARRVDARVAQLARRWDGTFLPWDSIAAFAAYDPYFRDIVHVSDEGRSVYSAWLGPQLLRSLVR